MFEGFLNKQAYFKLWKINIQTTVKNENIMKMSSFNIAVLKCVILVKKVLPFQSIKNT